MKEKFTKRILSLVLVTCLLLTCALPAAAASASGIRFSKVDNSAVVNPLDGRSPVGQEEEAPAYKDTDVVRVSIVLKEKSTIEAGYSTQGIASNRAAMDYRSKLEKTQVSVTGKISDKLGEKLDVVWNLTLAANIISANVKYGQIKTIEKVSGVKEVLIETMYEPDVVSTGTADPNMATSSAQIGSSAAWAAGYTGAGSRIAIIDTGTDVNHQSFSAAAFEYSLAYQAGRAGKTPEEYRAGLDLLDAEEIAAVADLLNVEIDPESAYINSKVPFGFNYVDDDYDILHVNDTASEHGSHVSGIAAANAYIPNGDGTFSKALDTVFVQGVAPDAQIITMKVFGKTGGAYDSDYMVAIEDAVILGADSVNLSLGSGSPGYSRSSTEEYQQILENLVNSGTVVTMSTGNSGSWVENAYNAGYLYADDVSMQTNGSPGSFTNSLSVASVDNDGTVGMYVSVGDSMIVYAESDYSNLPLSTLAGEQEFVFIDGIGTPEDWAAVGDALVGKIAICSRGTTSFFEKAEAAVEAGAIATIIYNNAAGIINLDLTDYSYTEPCVSITQADGAAIKAAATPVTDEEGNVLYYTGTMDVSNTMAAGQYNSDFYTMSSFSSWGVPGSLELKPEITAPGGWIYSVFGEIKGGAGGTDQYETMSGTSMAAPQVAGMAAVVAQYIRDNGLEENTGLNARTLAQSLLMSTAVPVIDGESGYYYSVLQQGAGLANVGAATSADSYIMMGADATASYADGKVKVELGDDPDRTGEYTFTFTINNLTDVEKVFTLGADFFIQAPTYDDYYNFYMHTSTVGIGAETTFEVDGKAVESGADLTGLDFNGDGAVNAADGQALLDLATGAIDALKANADKADLDADGDVDSYDAYLFFSYIEDAALIPANGSATVTVKVSVPESWKSTIDYYYPNGTYIQGYVYATGVSSEEGVAGTEHSIPVLGFYGNWTDASMYDVGTYQEYATGDETRMPYLGDPAANSFVVTYANEPDAQYYFGGNPLVPDDTYLPERNAINSADALSGVQFTLIRNAAASRFVAENTTTGDTLVDELLGEAASAYFHVNYGAWRNTGYTLSTKFSLADAAEGDVISAALTMAPEYYVDAEGNADWDALGAGATYGISAVVDNIAPELYDLSLSLTGNTLTATASDNNYVAAVALYNKSGTKVLAYTGAKQDIEKGEVAEYSFSLDGVNGKKFLLQVFDYAMNATTYVIEMQIGEEVPLPEMIAFDLTYNYWTTFTQETVYDYSVGMPVYEPSDLTFFAATIVDHMVLACTDTGDLYIMPEDDLSEMTYITNVGNILVDMAYNKADGKVYAVDQYGWLVEVDKLTGELTDVAEIGVLTNTLACDEDGTFYCNGYGTGYIYSFTLETIDEPAVLVDDIPVASQYVQTMEINPNTGMLCWNSYYMFWGMFGFSYYYEIDPATGEWTEYEDLWDEFSCLIIPEKTSGGGSWTSPTDEVSGLKLSAESLALLKGGSAQLIATVQPWTATDRTVTWSSADETVATVDDKGVVTAVGVGETTITAVSNLDPSFSATCTVTVDALDVTVKGTLQDEDGNPMFYEWNLGTDDTWTGGNAIDTSMTSATYSTGEKAYYIMDAVSDMWTMHKVGEDGVTIETAANGATVPLWDMAYSEYFTEVHGVENVSSIYYYYFLAPKDPMNLDGMAFNLSSRLSYLTAITSLGYEEYYDEDEGVMLDTEHIVLLDNVGTIWNFWIYDTEEGMSAWLNSYPSDLPCAFPGDEAGENMYTSMVVGDDGNLYVSAFNGDTNELYRLSFNAETESYVSARIGDVGDGVWPATITSVTTNAPEDGAEFVAPKATEKMDAVSVSAAELAAAKNSVALTTAKTHTMAPNAKAQKAAELNKFEVNAAEVAAVKPGMEIMPLSDATVGEGEKTVSVDITADEVSTNGVVTVTYDADVLTLIDAVVYGDYTSKVEQTGAVTFGYVKLDSFAADDVVARLTFSVKSTDDTTIDVSFKEVNNEAGTEDEIPVNYEHPNQEVVGAKAATCGEDGYTGDTYCTDCGKLIAEGEIIPATGEHSWDEGEVTKAPTCTEKGEKTYTCTVCGETKTEEVEATGHTWDEGVVTTEPTCTEKGVKTYTCACGETKTEEIPATGHSYEAVVTDPTCTEKGYTTYTCACGDSYVDDEVAPTGHSYVDGVCEHCGVGEPDPGNPKDGDNTMLSVAIAAAVVSAMSIAALPIVKKKLF